MNDPVTNGNASLLGSIFLTFISWFTPEHIDLWLKILTGFGAVVSACLAARYYIVATKERKQQIEINKRKIEENQK